MILYLGNMLAKHTGSVSVIENLAPKLGDKYVIRSASSKKRQSSRMLEMLLVLFRYRKETRLVLIDSYSTKAFWYTVAISVSCRLLGIPYVPILHGGNFPARLKKSTFWTNRVFKHSFTNVAPSAFLMHYFTINGFDTTFIPNHVETGNYRFTKRGNANPSILWVRAFHKMYNPQLAIDTLSLLIRDYPCMKLCMVGPDKDGSMAKAKEHSNKTGLNAAITFTGRLSQKEWSDLSSDYDIFLNTTDVDNTPVSVIEAMALGMLIVSTDVGGIPYLIQDEIEALLVPARDPVAMASAIKRLINDPELCDRLSTNARKKAEQFSWEIVGNSWQTLINKIISQT